MIKIAAAEDIELVFGLAMKFLAASPYKDLGDEGRILDIVQDFVLSPKEEKIVLLYEDKAFLAAAITKFPFGIESVATEVAWYVDPAYQKKGIGDQLITAFEYWADKLGVKVKTLAFMDKDLTEYMKKKGYVPYETVHYKMS